MEKGEIERTDEVAIAVAVNGAALLDGHKAAVVVGSFGE